MVPESVVIDLLRESGLQAYGDVPANRPEEFVTVELTGGTTNEALWDCTFAVQCWAKTRARAAEMCSEACEAIEAMRHSSKVAKSSVNSSYNYTDVTSGTPRYQITADIILMRH